MSISRVCPNPNSRLLAEAIVGGAGLMPPPDTTLPRGMGAVLLFVPLPEIAGKSPLDIQADLGLPWFVHGGEPMWFDDELNRAAAASDHSQPLLADYLVAEVARAVRRGTPVSHNLLLNAFERLLNRLETSQGRGNHHP